MSVSIGFIGTGGIANFHFNQLEQIEEAKITALCDVVKEKAEKAAKRFGGVAYTDYKEMLDKEKLDAIYICIPPFAHEEQELIAAEKGIAIMVEKPIAVTLEKAKEIEGAIEKAGVISSVGYNWRYLDTTDRAKQLLEGKKIAMALGAWLGGTPGVAWWRRKEQSGGQAVEQTTHIFDLARYMIGDVKSVFARGFVGLNTEFENYDVEDASLAILEFENGAIGHIASACISGSGEVGLKLFAKNLTVEMASQYVKFIERGRSEEYRSILNPYLREDQIFVEAVRTKDASKIRCPYSDGVKSLAVSLAVNESIESGKQVDIAG